jgi:hypothetical protein
MARLQKKMQAAGTTGGADQPAFPARWSSRLYAVSLVRRLVGHHSRQRLRATAGHQHRGVRTLRLHVRKLPFVRTLQRACCDLSRPSPPRLACRDDRAQRPFARGGMGREKHDFRKIANDLYFSELIGRTAGEPDRRASRSSDVQNVETVPQKPVLPHSGKSARGPAPPGIPTVEVGCRGNHAEDASRPGSFVECSSRLRVKGDGIGADQLQ